MISKLERAVILSAQRHSKGYQSLKAEDLEVVLAYLEGRVSLRALMSVLGFKNPGNGTHRVGAIIKKAVEKGIIKIEVVK